MLNGILNVKKEAGMTSHDVVAIVRHLAHQKRVGHTGTLDPLVTGVLPICLGKATRLSELISSQGKCYEGEMTLGYETDTGDRSGEVTRRAAVPPLRESQIREIFSQFTGSLLQTPPMVSAVKVKGKRLYAYAREGIEIERKAREITIHSLELLARSGNKIRFRCACSKGTYIRQLVMDMGKAFQSAATMTDLVRLQVGPFHIEDAISILTLKKGTFEELTSFLLPMDVPCQNLAALRVGSREGHLLRNGVTLYPQQWREFAGDDLEPTILRGDLLRVYDTLGFIGLGKYLAEADGFKMEKVLTDMEAGSLSKGKEGGEDTNAKN